MDTWSDSLIGGILDLVAADPIRLILAGALAGAGWVIIKLWRKLEAAQETNASLQQQMLERVTTLEQRAWRLSVDMLRDRNHRLGNEAD